MDLIVSFLDCIQENGKEVSKEQKFLILYFCLQAWKQG